MTTRAGSSAGIKPLTKRARETGQTFVRRPEVEAQLAEIVALDREEIFARLDNRNRDSGDYLFDETLVYLLREARRENDEQTVETLYPELNRRLWKLFKSYFKYFDEPADFEDFGQKVELEIIRKLLDVETDAADFAEVMFGKFVAMQTHGAWRGSLNRIVREKALFQDARPADGDDAPEPQFESKELSAEKRLILREMISKLPPNIMLVAALLLDGWQIESRDENEPTISKMMNVSSRTIRNWLKEARRILADDEGEKER
ncbi:MAG: hypothetical protein JSS81_22805 [Acidobacteria bacterium]|nr:hypothetical protein [Acidobacteriota bacterium]